MTREQIQKAAKLIMEYNDVDPSKIPSESEIKSINIVPYNKNILVTLSFMDGLSLVFKMNEKINDPEELATILRSAKGEANKERK